MPATLHGNFASALLTSEGRRIRIRAAELEDATACVAYLNVIGGESPYLTFGAEGPGISEDDVRRQVVRTAASENTLFLVADVDGEIIGALTFECGDRSRVRHSGEFGVSVRREYQSLGIGRALVEHLVQWAESGSTVRKLNLRVRVDNARAIALYEKLGFAIEGRLSRDVLDDGVFHDAFWMGRAVDPRT